MIPDSLRAYPQWLVSGEDKAPRSAVTGRLADVREASLYSSYDVAAAYAQQHGLNLGFALTPNDPFAVIDLDAPKNDQGVPDAALLTPEQKERHAAILNTFDTYAEFSRSGQGVHIWCFGHVPRGVKRDHVELYSSHRYMICTGRVVKDRPVTDQQELLDMLFDQVVRSSIDTTDLIEEDAILSDRQVFEMGMNAINGHKFDQLCRGDWQGDYPSQSEADFALMNMLCFYSRSNEQCRRLFRMSALGKREKAQREKYLDYMIAKIRAEELPRVDFSALGPPQNGQSPADVPTVLTPAPQPPEPIGNGGAGIAVGGEILYPPGFIGEIAQYITDTSIRPVREVGIAAAIAICAGVLGRQYNISGTGLNQYLILLAKTGVGKEGGAAGIERILHATRQRVPAVDAFVGPGTFASGQGLIRSLDEKHCFFSVMGEFGLTLQDLSDANAAGHTRVYRRVLLDLYTKSGRTGVVYSSAYSDKEKNTKTLVAPAFTLFGESTPELFYAGLSQSHIADGLIPRFLIIEYHGDRPDRNPNAFAAPPDELVVRFSSVVENALRMTANNAFANIAVDQTAMALFTQFDKECDRHIREGRDEATRQLWNRAHLKAVRMGGLLATATNPEQPIVTEADASWAVEMVHRDAAALTARFESGDVGEGASKQRVDLERVLKEYLERDLDLLRKYGVTELMKNRRVVPFVYISRRLANLSAFKKDRRGARAAVKDTVQELIDSNVLIELPKKQCIDDFGNHGKMYFISGAFE